jgi:hypothetical protein
VALGRRALGAQRHSLQDRNQSGIRGDKLRKRIAGTMSAQAVNGQPRQFFDEHVASRRIDAPEVRVEHAVPILTQGDLKLIAQGVDLPRDSQRQGLASV